MKNRQVCDLERSDDGIMDLPNPIICIKFSMKVGSFHYAPFSTFSEVVVVVSSVKPLLNTSQTCFYKPVRVDLNCSE